MTIIVVQQKTAPTTPIWLRVPLLSLRSSSATPHWQTARTLRTLRSHFPLDFKTNATPQALTEHLRLAQAAQHICRRQNPIPSLHQRQYFTVKQIDLTRRSRTLFKTSLLSKINETTGHSTHLQCATLPSKSKSNSTRCQGPLITLRQGVLGSDTLFFPQRVHLCHAGRLAKTKKNWCCSSRQRLQNDMNHGLGARVPDAKANGRRPLLDVGLKVPALLQVIGHVLLVRKHPIRDWTESVAEVPAL